jgi:hypothetical protein
MVDEDFSFLLIGDERPLTEYVDLAFPARETRPCGRSNAVALAAGYGDHGAPGERAVYHPGYYGVRPGPRRAQRGGRQPQLLSHGRRHRPPHLAGHTLGTVARDRSNKVIGLP